MICHLCQHQTATVCANCLSITLKDYHRLLEACSESIQRRSDNIEVHLKTRVVSTPELTNRIQNIRRETAFTRGLVTQGQRKVDELRDRFTSRRDALESANSSIQDSCQRSSNRLRTLNRAKRKDWKILFDGIVFERKRLVRTSLSLHGVKSCAVSKGSVASAGEMFEIGGRSAPPLFMHRECPTEQFNHVTSLVAQCGLLLSNYLGVKLPYGVILASSTNTKIGLLAGTSDQTMTLSLHENVSDSAGALARLIVDISHLCHVQGLRSHTDESNLVKMLFEMNASDYIGQYDDDTAFSTSRAKGKLNRERQEQSWDVQSLVDKVSHGLINEPFELIEHNSNHSSVYSIRDLHL